jgi:TniQ
MNSPYPLHGQLRPLPRRARLFPDETVSSYLHRLADANRLDTAALRAYLTSDRRKSTPIPIGNLAAVSGHSADALGYAMPELHDPAELASMQLTRRPRNGNYHRQTPACTHCTYAKGITQTVQRWARHDDVICRRHRRWTTSTDQPDLSEQPDIWRAHRQHQLLIRRHGQKTVCAAYTEAQHICHEWHCSNRHTDNLKHLLTRFFNGDFGRLRLDNPYSQAAAYPQIVALTRLLASEKWMTLVINDTPSEPDHGPPRKLTTGPGTLKFVAEIQRTVAPDYRWEPTQWGLRHESLVDRVAHAIHLRDYPDRHNPDPRKPIETFPNQSKPPAPLATFAHSYICYRTPDTKPSYRYVEHEQQGSAPNR